MPPHSFLKIPLDVGIIHFIGIGGIGMSGIAEAMKAFGYNVRGSDTVDSYNTERLRGKGIKIEIGHDPANVNGAAVVVTSTAVKADNPEVLAARRQRIPVVKRAEMLAELLRLKNTISIAGTHGKTTTTSIIGCILEKAGLDPTVINGGIINSYGTNIRLGSGAWMVVEADESDGTFIKIPSTVAIVTNLDPEHLDYWGDFARLKNAFHSFIENIPFYGFAVLCIDHPNVQELAASITDRTIITYGLSQQADVRAVNITSSHMGSRFDVLASGSQINGLRLPLLGPHNVVNALAAIAVAIKLGVSTESIKSALADFSGVKRRFTITGIANGVTVVDDYAHHPAEISTTLKSALDFTSPNGGRVIAVVQPHRYSRLKLLFNDFCASFNDADMVIVLDVYPAGEQPIEGFNGHDLAAGIANYRHKNVQYLSDPSHLPQTLAGFARPGDVILCMGAGDITRMAYELPGNLESYSTISAPLKTA